MKGNNRNLLSFLRPRILVYVVLIVALPLLVACGSASDSTSAPAAAPAVVDTSPNAQPAAADAASEPAPTAVPAAAGEAPMTASTEGPTGTLRIALDEIGPPRWIPKLQGGASEQC